MGSDNGSIKATSRINYIDFLKFIGLTGIIIAHVDSPRWAIMLRSFDVPLMVIISSILANRSYSKSRLSTSVIQYYISRIKRLVIPTWIFLLFYFLFCFVATGQRESLIYYISSFCLTNYGIGCVWIILIYLYSAMLIPLFDKLKLYMKSIIIVMISYCVYEIAYYYRIGLDVRFVKYFVDVTFYYIIPYGVLAYLGYNYFNLTNRYKLIIILVSFATFACLAIYYWGETGTFQIVQIAKYPPRLYYMSYGIGCSFALLLICEKKNLKVLVTNLYCSSQHIQCGYTYGIFLY